MKRLTCPQNKWHDRFRVVLMCQADCIVSETLEFIGEDCFVDPMESPKETKNSFVCAFCGTEAIVAEEDTQKPTKPTPPPIRMIKEGSLELP